MLPHSSKPYDLAPRDPISINDIILKYDTLLLKTLHKLQTTSKQLENDTKVSKTGYSQLQHELAYFNVDEDVCSSIEDDDKVIK